MGGIVATSPTRERLGKEEMATADEQIQAILAANRPVVAGIFWPLGDIAADTGRCPVASTQHSRLPEITSYRAARELLRRPSAFSTIPGGTTSSAGVVPFEHRLIDSENEPARSQHRQALSDLLSAPRTERHEHGLKEILNRVVDGVAAKGGRFDLIGD
nr:hypothetical protein [Micromonospora sp. DSM 115978]